MTIKKITIRDQKVSDAQEFFDILNNPNFKYFRICPKNVEEEKEYLKQNAKKRKNNISYNYAILYEDKLIGGCGININQFRPHIGEIGYFIDEKYWGKGIATKVVKLLEKISFQELNLIRIEILMNPRNIGSEKVAIKNKYKKEGTMKKVIKEEGKFFDAHLYAKVKKFK